MPDTDTPQAAAPLAPPAPPAPQPAAPAQPSEDEQMNEAGFRKVRGAWRK